MAKKSKLSNTMQAGNVLIERVGDQIVAVQADARDVGKDPVSNAPAVQPNKVMTRTQIEMEAGRKAVEARRQADLTRPKRPEPPAESQPVFRPNDHLVQQRDPMTGSVMRFAMPRPNPNNPAPREGVNPYAVEVVKE
jgi:hypothetical protein